MEIDNQHRHTVLIFWLDIQLNPLGTNRGPALSPEKQSPLHKKTELAKVRNAEAQPTADWKPTQACVEQTRNVTSVK